jgi:hypothetical protein
VVVDEGPHRAHRDAMSNAMPPVERRVRLRRLIYGGRMGTAYSMPICLTLAPDSRRDGPPSRVLPVCWRNSHFSPRLGPAVMNLGPYSAAWVHSASPKPVAGKRPQSGIPELTEDPAPRIKNAGSPAFRGRSSAPTVSIFLEPVAGTAPTPFCVGCHVLVMV